MIKVITANEAAAYAVLLVQPAVMTSFPITPQSRIPEQLVEFCTEGLMKGKFVTIESEMTAISYVMGASYGGVRVFTSTSSQGLAWMDECLYTAAVSHLPIVMVNCNRVMASGITLGQDDSLSHRDTGWLQFYCESNQEVLDTVLQAYRLAESVFLPVMVCIDGFYLTLVSEGVDIPDQKLVDRFLPPYDPTRRALMERVALPRFRKQPPPYAFERRTGGTANKYEHQKLELQSLDVAEKVDQEFKAIFGRSYPLVEEYRCDDAEMVFVTIGSAVGTARYVINDLRKRGYKVGLVKLKMFRPFPVAKVRQALSGRKKVAVFERDISPGQCGIVYQEIKWALYDNTPIYGFVGGLVGEDITPQLIEKAIMYTLEHDPPQQETSWLGLERKEVSDDYDRNSVQVF